MYGYKISKGEAIDLQEWALNESRTKKYLDSLPKLPKKGKIKPELYVSYKLDESEFDGGLDWPDIGVARVYAVFEDGEETYLGEVRAYNWETIWLSTNKFEEVDTAENWGEIINEEHEIMKKESPIK